MNQRLLQFINAEKLSQSQFADSIGVARASITHIISGRNKPGFDFIVNMSKRYPNLNLEWLLTGDGDMYKGTSAAIADASSVNSYPQAQDIVDKAVIKPETRPIGNTSSSVGKTAEPIRNNTKPDEPASAVEDDSYDLFSALQYEGQNESMPAYQPSSNNTETSAPSARPSEFRKAAHYSGTRKVSETVPSSRSYTSQTTAQPAGPKTVAKVLILFSDGTFQELKRS